MQKSQTTINSRSQPPIPPMPLYQAALVFAATSLVFFGFLYVLLPLLRRNNVSWFACFNLTLAAPVFLLVACALLAYAWEGNPLRWHDLRDRFRLRRMDLSSWLWTVGLAIFMFGGRYASFLAFACVLSALGLDRSLGWKQRIGVSLGVAAFLTFSWLIWQTRSFFAAIPLHSLPLTFQEFQAHLVDPEAFMGIPLPHEWWVAVYYTCVLVLGNIAGEELWWRGYLLPRQEAASGAVAWLYNGLLWAAFHLFAQTTAWDMIRMMPTCCALAFVAQYRKNTWPGIVAHTVGNGPILIGIVHGIVS
jgi:membrane protease YdiL (CAAX protease family)